MLNQREGKKLGMTCLEVFYMWLRLFMLLFATSMVKKVLGQEREIMFVVFGVCLEKNHSKTVMFSLEKNQLGLIQV
jgi:hypothetical protein